MAENNLKVLPNSIEAEKSILGALLVSPEAIYDIIDILRADDFYRKDHQTIFEAMMSLYNTNTTIDVITVSDKLQAMSALDNVGGIAYLGSLAEDVPLAANAVQYARIVADKSTQRKLITCAREIAQNAYEPDGDISKSVEFAEQSILEVSKNKAGKPYAKIGDVMPSVVARIEEAAKKEDGIQGIPSGFYDLDKMTAGFHPENLVIIAGRPGAGKTAFMLNIVRHVAVKAKLPVAVFNLEMSKEELATRILSTQANIESSKLKTGQLDEADWIKVAEGASELADVPIYFDDTTDNSVQAIKSKCRKLKMEKDIKMVVVDYLQLMNSSGRSENRATEVAEMSRGLKVLARELGVPVLVGSQLNRESEKRAEKRPQISDLRESGAIEQDADLVILLYRPDMDTTNQNPEVPQNKAEAIVAKQRNGATGTVNLIFEGDKMTFRNMSFRNS